MLGNFAFLGLGLPLLVIAILVGTAILVFEIMMIISAVTNKKIEDDRRILWVIGMLLIHPFVAIAYYFTDYKKAQ
jgi:uncharacterized membrane protein HdeD (DUF308 family)